MHHCLSFMEKETKKKKKQMRCVTRALLFFTLFESSKIPPVGLGIVRERISPGFTDLVLGVSC